MLKTSSRVSYAFVVCFCGTLMAQSGPVLTPPAPGDTFQSLQTIPQVPGPRRQKIAPVTAPPYEPPPTPVAPRVQNRAIRSQAQPQQPVPMVSGGCPTLTAADIYVIKDLQVCGQRVKDTRHNRKHLCNATEGIVAAVYATPCTVDDRGTKHIARALHREWLCTGGKCNCNSPMFLDSLTKRLMTNSWRIRTEAETELYTCGFDIDFFSKCTAQPVPSVLTPAPGQVLSPTQIN